MQANNLNIILPYKPRDVFKEYHATPKRNKISICHRRSGKTVARVNTSIRRAVSCKLPNPKIAYLAPSQTQAKDIAWRYFKQYCAPFFDYGAKTNETELSITLPFNRAVIKLYGAQNANAMRGNYFDYVVVDEAQDISRKMLGEIILPTLLDRGGGLDISGTPKGWTNVLGQLYKEAEQNPEFWYFQILKASESKLLPESELAFARSFMSENEYEQEFECSFDAAITGAVYGKWIAQAASEGRLNHDIKPASKIYTAWDLGWGDSTAIWWWQVVNNEIHILDYYENSGHDVPHYVRILVEKAKQYGYNYDQHFAPHDVVNGNLASGGRSVLDRAQACGVELKRVPSTSQENQIESTRATLPRCWFDKKCEAEGLEALRHYHFKKDDKRQSNNPEPHHDWSSHGCDAFEIIAQVWHIVLAKQKTPEKPKFWEDLTINELIRMR